MPLSKEGNLRRNPPKISAFSSKISEDFQNRGTATKSSTKARPRSPLAVNERPALPAVNLSNPSERPALCERSESKRSE
jgi:hypothetical protein